MIARTVRRCRRVFAGVLFALFAASVVSVLAAPDPGRSSRAPVAYTVHVTAPATHYVDVDVTVPADGQPSIEMMMAVWTPGSYLVREYESQVESFRARAADGHALVVEKTRKNRWRIRTDGTPVVSASYRIYCHELSVRHNWVEDDLAVLNGAPTFVTLVGGLDRPHDVRLDLPAFWKAAATPLPPAPDGRPNHFLAPDFDTLVDSPILAGRVSVHRFDVDGRPHALVNAGDESMWDVDRSVADLKRIVAEWRRVWGQLPYPSYGFLNVILEPGGGIEHRNSTLLMVGPWTTRTAQGYESWLGLASHEFLHAWNVKRLRPVELGPFDYEHENYTRSLWEAEGFTEYYGDLALPRAGIVDRDAYLLLLSNSAQALHATPGRLVLPLEQASFDAWIKEYRPDENTVNSAISYYTKGAQVAFLLDAKVRRATGGARSLDDVMRLAWERYSGQRGFTGPDFCRAAEDVAGIALGAWFDRVLRSTEELDYSEALDWFGLRVKPVPPPAAGRAKAWMGASTRISDGRLLVSEVPRETPAYGTGLSAGDEILAIDDYRVRPGELEDRLAQYSPGQEVVLLVSRNQRLRRARIVLGAEPARRWMLEVAPGATDAQSRHLQDWLRIAR